MGMYKDDLQLFARLQTEMFRACRVVIDTGLHTKGWSIEQSKELLSKYLSYTETEMLSEINR